MSQLQSSALKTRWGPEAKERDTEELAMEYLSYDRVQVWVRVRRNSWLYL